MTKDEARRMYVLRDMNRPRRNDPTARAIGLALCLLMTGLVAFATVWLAFHLFGGFS